MSALTSGGMRREFTLLAPYKSNSRLQAYNRRMQQIALVVVQRFATEVEANLARSMLESAGIDSMIQADRAGGMRDHLAWSGFGFKLLVREEDAATAREVLKAPDSELVPVHVFGSQAEADAAQGALLSAGIVAMIQADPAGSLLGLGTVRVLVREEDAATAREVLTPPKQAGA